MKQSIFFILMISIISCQRNDSSNSDSPININAEILRTFDSIYVKDNETLQTYNVKLSLTNVSDKPIAYWTMTCAWPDNWLTNKDNYQVIWSNSCDSNFPMPRRLNPKEKFTYNVFVCRSKYESMYHNENKLKLGFIYIDTVVCKDRRSFGNFIGDRSTNRIFWSNPIDLK
jgi:hypothetical protein